MHFQIYNEECLKVLKTFSSNSVDSMVTDPPAGIGFLNLDWDHNKGGREEWICWLCEIMKECHRVLKPGAYGFVGSVNYFVSNDFNV